MLRKVLYFFARLRYIYISRRYFCFGSPISVNKARIVCLIKPQFEAGRQAVGKNGVVKDPKAHKRVLHTLLAFFAGQRCRLEQLTYSPITGGEGNIEYLAALTYWPDLSAPVNDWDVDALVEQAHRHLNRRHG